MKKDKRITILCTIVIFILFIASLSIGRYHIDFKTIINFLTFRKIDDTSYNVLLNLRLYRIFVAFFVGVALALSGTIYQSILNNVLVSPDILGISSGASVGACVGILLGLSYSFICMLSFAFALLSLILCYLLSRIIKHNSLVSLILSGIAIQGLMSSIVGLMKYLADSEYKLSEMILWLLGDISKIQFSNSFYYIPVIVICTICCYVMSWKLNIVSLGRREAKNLGMNYELYVSIFIVLATIMTALSVAFCGIISFVGLVIPNISRLIIGNDNRKVVKFSSIFGGIFILIADTIARSIAPNEIPISVIAGIFGTPILILILRNRVNYEC